MVTVGDVANVATALAVVVALVLGLHQIREGQRQRREAVAIDFLHATQSPAFTHAMRLLLDLPERAPAERIQGSPELQEAVYTVGHTWEAVGILVFRRLLPIEIVDDLQGGSVRMLWARVAPYAESCRRQYGSPNFMEWVQWLAERLAELDRPEKRQGAHVAHRAWAP